MNDIVYMNTPDDGSDRSSGVPDTEIGGQMDATDEFLGITLDRLRW